MKLETQIRDLLEQYEFDRKIERETYSDCINYQTPRQDLIINILKWVLEDEEKISMEVFDEYES